MYYAIVKRSTNGFLVDDLRQGRAVCISPDYAECEHCINISAGGEIIESGNGMDFYDIQMIKCINMDTKIPRYGRYLFSLPHGYFQVKKAV